MRWQDVQDRQIDAHLDLRESILNQEAPVERVGHFIGSFIQEKHILNVFMVKSRNQTFRLLDIGCGTGELIHQISTLFPNAELIGIDSNLKSIEESKRNGSVNSHFIAGGYGECGSFAPFDFVISSEVLEHVEGYSQFLDTLCGSLRKDGYLSISTPSGWMFRMLRYFNLKMILRHPKKFYELYLTPEKHWAEAVKIHPAIQPSKLIRMLEARGFRLLRRQSALWTIKGDRGLLFHVIRRAARSRPILAASTLYHLTRVLDSLMNLFPPFRIFESRYVLLMQKTIP